MLSRRKSLKCLICSVLILVLAAETTAQESKLPDLTGFTKSPTEHQVVVIEQPFTVRSVRGVISFKNHAGEPLPRVLFEMIGPGDSKKIRRDTSSEDGNFKIVGVPQGSYRFKTTRDGFGSVFGTVVVSKRADKTALIHIDVPVGN